MTYQHECNPKETNSQAAGILSWSLQMSLRRKRTCICNFTHFNHKEMLQSISKEKNQMTVYPNGVCYLNAALFSSIKKRASVPVKVSIKTDGNGHIIIIPITSPQEIDKDSRKVSLRGGGGSFSCKTLAESVNSLPSVIEFDGPQQIDANNPSGFRSAKTFEF